MKRPKLINVTGLPYSGISQVQDYLVKDLGVIGLYKQKELEKLIGENPPDKIDKDTKYTLGVQAVKNIEDAKFQAIKMGFDVFTDSLLLNNFMQDSYFSKPLLEHLFGSKINSDNMLIYLDVDRDVLLQRAEKSYGKETVLSMEEIFEEPKSTKEFEVVKYKNNTSNDLERIFEDLKDRFGRK